MNRKLKKSTEDYLKTIYILNKKDGVRGVEIAEVMNVSRPSVSVALKALKQEVYVWINEHRHVFLTDLGLSVATETYEKNCFFRICCWSWELMKKQQPMMPVS